MPEKDQNIEKYKKETTEMILGKMSVHVKTYKKIKTLKDRITGQMRGQASDIQRETLKLMNKLEADNVDARLKLAEGEAVKRMRIEQTTQAALKELAKRYAGALELAGGEDELIDTVAEADIFQRNYLYLLRSIDLSDLVEQSHREMMGLEKQPTQVERIFEIMEKINLGKELNDADYRTALSFMTKLIDETSLTKSENLVESVKSAEKTGGLALLHGLNPKQRMEMLKRAPEKDRYKLVKGLTMGGYLTIEQAKHIFRNNPEATAAIEADISSGLYKKAQDSMKDFRKRAEKWLAKAYKINYARKILTPTGILLFEGVGRAAVFYVVVTALANARGGKWKDPKVLAAMAGGTAVAVSTLEWATGGTFVKKGATKPRGDVKKQIEERKRNEWMRDALMNRPQLTKYITNNSKQIFERYEKQNAQFDKTKRVNLEIPDKEFRNFDGRTKRDSEAMLSSIISRSLYEFGLTEYVEAEAKAKKMNELITDFKNKELGT